MRLWVRSLPLLSGFRIQRCRERGVGCRRGSDPALLWLWCRLVATVPIRPLAWEPSYADRAALEKAKRPKKKRRKSRGEKGLSRGKDLSLPAGDTARLPCHHTWPPSLTSHRWMVSVGLFPSRPKSCHQGHASKETLTKNQRRFQSPAPKRVLVTTCWVLPSMSKAGGFRAS